MKAKILVYSMKLRTGKHVGLLEPPALDHSSTFTPFTALEVQLRMRGTHSLNTVGTPLLLINF